MKKLCLFFMLFALLPAMSKSQFVSTDTTTQETYEEVATHIFQQFDFSPLETGFFDEWGAPFAKLEWYNGQLTEENIIDYYAWWRIYTKLSLSKVNENAYPLPEENELKDLMETKSNQYENSVPLPIILMEYERFKPSAMEEKLIGYNDDESYFEILNEDYYQKEVLFAVSQASYSIQGLNAMFFVDEELIFKNIPHKIVDIQIDFGDGSGFQHISLNENIFIAYGEAGEKEITYRVELDNDEVLYSHSVINVIAVYPQTFDYSFNITANEAYMGQKASATVYVVYACGNNKLRKPLIVLEGIDHPQVLQMGMTGNGFIEILRKIKESNNLENYIDINGYDLVIVDYHHGADYIQRNALMVETVVEWANAQKAANGSVSKNMLLGVSMGGLVGRYALRDMELKSKNHDTELFVSFDAPHLGANLPYGMQLAIDQAWWVVNGISSISSDSEAKKFPRLAYEMQHNPAARQMVVYQTGHISGDYPSLFNDFQNTLASMGMPQNCRNVSVVNGSDVGHNQNFNAGDKIFELNANAALLAPNFNAALLAVTLKVYFGLDFQADVDAWFTPATSATWRKVYDGLYTKKVLWTTVWKHHMISEASGSTVPYDNAPGGTFSIELDGGAGQNISGLQIFKPEFNHIPSVSSIYLNVPERYDLNYNLSSQSILSKTGFNNFVANPYDAVSNRFNTSHIEINATTANWAIEEIGLNRVNTTINILSNNSFNFTNLTTDRISTSSFTIHQNGKLKVNTNTTSGYLNSGLSAPQQGSSFCLYTNANDCGTVYLEVQNGGEIVLGDNSTGNIGYLYLTRNSILKMKSGSTLTINNNSKLIIEPGAKIIYESGAIINLNGTNAVFEVQGNGILEIADNAIFSFNGNGFFRFNNTTSQTLAFGTNFHFYLNGSSQNNKLLELTNNAILSFPYGTGNTRKFTATNCNIDILSGSIEVKSDLNMSDVKISGGIYSTLKTFGQDPVDIENCTFQNVTYYATQSQEQENEIFLTINSCTFENSGVSVYDKGFSLSNSTFDESYLAVENLTLPSTVYNTLFNNANINTSVYYTNISNAVPLILDNVSINGLNDNGDYGILNTGGIVKLKCTDVNATISAIALYTGAKIDMSTQNGGIYNRNLLSKSSSTSSEDYPLIETYEAEMIYLDEGQNVLKKLVNAKYIKGTFNNTNNIEITAENNKWHPQLYASSTTPLASNFALSSITNNIPVDIDYSPISSATLEACGSQSSMMMSGSDPCDGPFGCPNSMNVLDNCPSCSNVKIGGVAINKKLKKVFREMAEDTLKVKLNHNLNRLDSILNFEVTANLPAVENLKDRAYSNYIELYQTKISQSVQSSLSNISLTNKVMAVTNARLNKAIAHNDTSRIVKYLLSKTSLYLNKNDDYTTPLNLLNTALNYTDPNTAMYAFIQSQICVITTESLYVNRMISSSEFDSLKQECKVLYSIKPSASRVVYQEEKESLLNNSETELHLYPNPANTDLNIILTNTPESNYNYKIMDVSGRTILKHHIEQTSNFNINISELPQGVYMFEIESGGILKTGKFVIVR